MIECSPVSIQSIDIFHIFPSPKEKLLEDDGVENNEAGNYWLTQTERGQFTLDLGCEKYVLGIRLRYKFQNFMNTYFS